MHRIKLTALALLGIAAFAVAPAAAQAEGPHWYRNGIPLPAGFPVKVETVGSLTFKDPAPRRTE